MVGVAGVEVREGGDGPAPFMDEVMVTAAEQEHVGQGRFAAVFPVGDVVGFGARAVGGAGREAAGEVADLQGSA